MGRHVMVYVFGGSTPESASTILRLPVELREANNIISHLVMQLEKAGHTLQPIEDNLNFIIVVVVRDLQYADVF